MIIRLQKIVPHKNQRRFYTLSVQPTLFGEWAFVREWGRIGNDGGKIATEYFPSESEALEACEILRIQKSKRGYVVRPQQLGLPFWG